MQRLHLARRVVLPPARRLTAPRRPLAARAAAGAPPSPAPPPPPPADDAALAAFASAQRDAPRPPLADVARTLAALAGTGVLSTVGRDGWAAGSVVQTAADADGAPVLALSSLSAHTRELTADPRCALTLLAPGFAGMQDARATLTCVARALEGEAAAAARAVFMAAHPDAFWADFGDFSWWRLDPTGGARVVAGFGRAGSVSADQYRAAAPDPVAPFAPPVCGHMNADHGDAVAAMVAAAAGGAQAGVTIERATMLSVDRLGFDADAVVAGAGGGVVRARVPFSAPADDRKALKERLVELTRAAAAAASK